MTQWSDSFYVLGVKLYRPEHAHKDTRALGNVKNNEPTDANAHLVG